MVFMCHEIWRKKKYYPEYFTICMCMGVKCIFVFLWFFILNFKCIENNFLHFHHIYIFVNTYIVVEGHALCSSPVMPWWTYHVNLNILYLVETWGILAPFWGFSWGRRRGGGFLYFIHICCSVSLFVLY